MTKNVESKNIDQLLAEADAFVRQISSGFVKDMEEAHRLQLEKHAQDLKQMKTDAERKIKEKPDWVNTKKKLTGCRQMRKSWKVM